MSDPNGAWKEEVIFNGDDEIWVIVHRGWEPHEPWLVEQFHPVGVAGLYWPEKTFGDGFDEDHGIIVEAEEGAMEAGYVVKNRCWRREDGS
jgi:hypothetical protein